MNEYERANADTVIKGLTKVIEDIREGILIVDSFEENKRWTPDNGNRRIFTVCAERVPLKKDTK